VIFRFTLKKGAFQGFEDLSGKISVSADIPTPGPEGEAKIFAENQDVVYNIIPFGPSFALSSPSTEVVFTGAAHNEQPVTITALMGEVAAKDVPVTTRVTLSDGTSLDTVFEVIIAVPAAETGATAATATAKADADGKIVFTYKLKVDNTTEKTGNINYSCEDGTTLNIPFKINRKSS
jgi:hypothetical protein